MKKRPLSLKIYASIMWAITAGFPLQTLFLQDQPVYMYFNSWHFLSDLNIITMALTWALAYHALQASNRLFVIAPVATLIMALNNWWVGFIGFDYPIWQTTLATLGFFTSHVMLFEKDALKAIKNPSLQWWRTAERKRTAQPVTIHPWVGESFIAESFDISESGIYVVTNDFYRTRVGERVQLRVNFDGLHDVRCTARVVRTNATSGAQPMGVGLAFEDIASSDKNFIKGYRAQAQKFEASA